VEAASCYLQWAVKHTGGTLAHRRHVSAQVVHEHTGVRDVSTQGASQHKHRRQRGAATDSGGEEEQHRHGSSKEERRRR
jgi:hypothetical protein